MREREERRRRARKRSKRSWLLFHERCRREEVSVAERGKRWTGTHGDEEEPMSKQEAEEGKKKVNENEAKRYVYCVSTSFSGSTTTSLVVDLLQAGRRRRRRRGELQDRSQKKRGKKVGIERCVYDRGWPSRESEVS
jgi:hypothetical protein